MKEDLYVECFGSNPDTITKITGEGSPRAYYRLSGSRSAILTEGTSLRENDAFIYLTRLFRDKGLPVPDIYRVSADGMAYLQSDLGDTSLYSLISRYGIDFPDVEKIYMRLVSILPEFQFGHSKLDKSRLYPRESMDHRAAMWDLNYFKYCFLKAVVKDFDEDALESDLLSFADDVIYNPEGALILRDLQSRNVMVVNDHPYIIDYQGARRGSCLYDLASLLWQARAGIPADMRQRLINQYLESLNGIGIEIENFQERFYLTVLFRLLQVLGAYGFRGYFERKAQFLTSIVPAVMNLREVLSDINPVKYTYLVNLLSNIVDLPQFAPPLPRSGLLVTVKSFSYKMGSPEDLTGNGGGFVFDCRAVHNPGRYDEYKHLTGEDAPVMEFLERDGEMIRFLEHCYALVDASVERYIDRGFSDLMVCFGCTGGRHRSVYGAMRMAEHIHKKYGVAVSLEHREQGIVRKYEAI